MAEEKKEWWWEKDGIQSDEQKAEGSLTEGDSHAWHECRSPLYRAPQRTETLAIWELRIDNPQKYNIPKFRTSSSDN